MEGKKASIKEENVQAISYYTGMMVKVNDIEVWTSVFKKTSCFLLFLLASSSILAVIIVLILFWEAPSVILMVTGIIVLVILIPWSLILEQKTAEWHAAEHKLIYLLTTGKKMTMKNLREAPAFSEKCGDNNECLKKPSEEKLKEALELGKKILLQIET